MTDETYTSQEVVKTVSAAIQSVFDAEGASLPDESEPDHKDFQAALLEGVQDGNINIEHILATARKVAKNRAAIQEARKEEERKATGRTLLQWAHGERPKTQLTTANAQQDTTRGRTFLERAHKNNGGK
ncbi:MAG: hypothetical protein HY864_09760 [Chloroflexi bacterium]|nr:hypothetical protein [Chloroflexota bacterium]